MIRSRAWLFIMLTIIAFATLLPGSAPKPINAQTTVQVIIQKNPSTVAIDDLITSIGGIVTRDLALINAIVARIPAESLPHLANQQAVRSITLDMPVQSAGLLQQRGNQNKPTVKLESATVPVTTTVTTTVTANNYLETLRVPAVWAMGLDGKGIGVAVIDSGIAPNGDFSSLRVAMSVNPGTSSPNDTFGHGTHVAGILAGNGANSHGQIRGIAPGVDLLSLKIGDDKGVATESDIVAAMQWVLQHKAEYNIRVVNLSVNSTVEQSYHQSPLSAAAEILWFNGIVVVTATGNKNVENGFNPVLAAPANDPFIITVGASDEKGDSKRNNDAIATFTAYDQTAEGFVKPEVMAPGVDIYSVLSKESAWYNKHPERMTADGQYFRLSGSSMATPMVAGAIALLLQAEPQLTPDQVKYRLLATAGRVGKANYLDVYAMVTQKTTESANIGVAASQLLWTGSEPVQWQSINWNAVNWNAVNWNAVNWNAVNWNAVNWNSISWQN